MCGIGVLILFQIYRDVLEICIEIVLLYNIFILYINYKNIYVKYTEMRVTLPLF